MDQTIASDTTLTTPEADGPAIEAASFEYLGRWTRLVSTTNWEKGRIIAEWRDALIDAGAFATSYTDEAWARCVGNVTPQHTGRLRRVYQRFTSMRETYRGLFWSHFQAALDWDDAEMWLEGAVQSNWSIAQMQGERARTLGSLPPSTDASDADVVDEDATEVARDLAPDAVSNSMVNVRSDEAGDFQPHPSADASRESAPLDATDSYNADSCNADSFAADDRAPVRPFENLPSLPADLQNAFESFKLAIIHHRLGGWQEISQQDILGTLEALRKLALAPLQA